jgi:NADH-quinone oxidoreductase subunit J
MISGHGISFYLLSAVILVAGLLSVTSRKIFRSAIWLLFSLVGTAGLFFWMDMEFIAAVQIIVYVGGIVVLIIFSIFLTQETGQDLARPLRHRAILAIVASVFGLALANWLIQSYPFRPAPTKAWVMSVSDIGDHLLSMSTNGYALPLEVVSILLLAAMVGCIVIAMKIKSNK